MFRTTLAFALVCSASAVHPGATASPAEPGLRPTRPHGKPVATSTSYKRGEHLQADARVFPTCTIVVAEYGSPRDVALVRQWAPSGCLVHVYSKSGRGACSQLGPNGPTFVCEELPNVGRELGTYLLYVSRHYASLPDRLHFVPAPLNELKYHRGGMLQAFIKATGHPFLCVQTGVHMPVAVGYAPGGHRLHSSSVAHGGGGGGSGGGGAAAGGEASSMDATEGAVERPDTFQPPSRRAWTFDDPRGCYANTGSGVPCLEFELPLYNGQRLARTVYPLRAFVEQHLGPWVSPEDLASSVVCLHGVFSTTRRNLLAYPRHVYDSLRNQTDVADASEAVHMLERLAQVVFGAATIRGGRVMTVRNTARYKRLTS